MTPLTVAAGRRWAMPCRARGERGDTPDMATSVEPRHWVNTVVGMLDSVFYLSDHEQLQVGNVVRQVMKVLHIAARPSPVVLPPPLAQEVSVAYWSHALEGPRRSGLHRNVRSAGPGDVVLTVETWREALVGMFTTAYPDMNPEDRVFLTKVFDDLLAAIGAPARAAAYVPEIVISAIQDVEGPRR